VDVSDLATGTDGELITWDSDGNPDTVATGTSGQVLTSNGVGAAPTFQDATGGTDPSDGFTLDENTSIKLDPALSADGKYCAVEAEDVTAGTALAFGEVAYYAVADSKWEKTDADAEATAGPVKIGIVVVAAAEDATATVMFKGKIREDDWNWATIGAPVYLDTATAGGMTLTKPIGQDDVQRKVGYVIDANTIWFEPDTYYLLAGHRISSETSSATPTINTNNVEAHSITALAADITSMTTNLSGTPTNFQRLIVRIKDDGTARSITWGASFEDAGHPLPTTTVISKLLTVLFIYNSVTSKWGCISAVSES
jgi:hypothetical protein